MNARRPYLLISVAYSPNKSEIEVRLTVGIFLGRANHGL
jgi:hypothetical protein